MNVGGGERAPNSGDVVCRKLPVDMVQLERTEDREVGEVGERRASRSL